MRRRSFSGNEVVKMEYAMEKKTLDTWGGIGSLLGAVFCLWLAIGHEEHDHMFTVWLVVCAVLAVNGIAMLITANRAKANVHHHQ